MDMRFPLIFSHSAAWEKGSFAASPADSSVRQYPVRSRRKRQLYWAMAAALDLHREAALPVPLPGGLPPSVLPSQDNSHHHSWKWLGQVLNVPKEYGMFISL